MKALPSLDNFKLRLWQYAKDEAYSLWDIERFIGEFFIHQHLFITIHNYQAVCRCRLNKPGEIFTNVSCCSYNPLASTVTLQRCNYPGQQMFYATLETGATDMNASTTAIIETAAEYISNEDISYHDFTISNWEIHRPLNLFVFPCSKKSIKSNPHFELANRMFDEDLMKHFGQLPTEIREAYLQYCKDVIEFMSDVFCKEEEKKYWYRVSAAFVNYILKYAEERNEPIDGLIYPSANSHAKGMNIVLKKELIDTGVLTCYNVQLGRFARHPQTGAIYMFPISANIPPKSDGTLIFVPLAH